MKQSRYTVFSIKIVKDLGFVNNSNLHYEHRSKDRAGNTFKEYTRKESFSLHLLDIQLTYLGILRGGVVDAQRNIEE